MIFLPTFYKNIDFEEKILVFDYFFSFLSLPYKYFTRKMSMEVFCGENERKKSV